VLKGFGDLGPPRDILETAASVYNGVDHATKELIKIASESSVKSTRRMIVVTSLEEYEHLHFIILCFYIAPSITQDWFIRKFKFK